MKILSVRCRLISSPVKGTKIHGQSKNLKTVAIIEAKTKSYTGYGEAYVGIYIPEITYKIIQSLEIEFINLDIEEAIHKIANFKIPFASNAGIYRSIIGSIEISFYDLKARSKNIPLYKLFTEIASLPKLYASGGSVISGVKELEKDFNLAESQGFDSFKMRVGKKEWQEDVKRVDYAKNRFPNHLMVDSIYGTRSMNVDFNTQLAMYKELEQFDLVWLEEPLPVEDISMHYLLRNNLSIPLAAGEAYSSLTEFEALINVSGIDIVQFDVTQSGGMLNSLKVFNMAIEKKKKTAFHVWGSMVAEMANFHLALAMKELYFFEVPLLELVFNEDIHQEKHETAFELFSTIPESPGLGISIDDSTFDKYNYVSGTEYKW